MRKGLLGMILVLIVCLSACATSKTDSKSAMDTNENEIRAKIGDNIGSLKRKAGNRICYERYSCLAWENSETYYIACTGQKGETVRGVAVFSKNLELINATGIEPIEDIVEDEWVGKLEKDFVDQYGQCHFEEGSGLYMPSYISKTGKIYSLYVDGGRIYRIACRILNKQPLPIIVIDTDTWDG